jgi:hypothetical protein
MGQKLVVGPFTKGLRNDVTPFNIDNDSFPVLINAYQWRGRVKRKRGTSLWGRLQRYFNSNSISYSSHATATLLNDGSGNGTTTLTSSFQLQSTGMIIPGTVIITDTSTMPNNIYTDPGLDGILVGTPAGTGTINYASTFVTITGAAGDNITAVFVYYPNLPVMGIEDFYNPSSAFPNLIDFDTTYAYDSTPTQPPVIYDVSFYKNPPNGIYPGYVAKTNETPVTWNGANYQQFWTVNYQGALWTTNGIDVPFTGSTIGMQFAPASSIVSATQVSATTVNFVITGSPLVVGDFVFANEFTGTSGPTLNYQTGYVTVVAGTTYTVVFPNATIGAAGLVPGILQYLTNRSSTTRDCLRWYDGDPTNGSATNPVLNGTRGWVNFMPPLSNLPYTINDLIPAQYYLVGARVIFNFKDRLIFFGPVVQTSTGVPIYLNDTIVYSQNGTPYYTASFPQNANNNAQTLATTATTPILVPTNQTAVPGAYFEDVSGFGGWISSGLDQDITSVTSNEDVLIVGFTNKQTRLIYSGNDIIPFSFFVINSEFGSGNAFGSITLDKGAMTKGSRGFIVTSQTDATRIDLSIPDAVFEQNLFNNGTERFTAIRDFINEWVYFTYCSDQIPWIFPNQTLQYNYRDNSWALFYENYTTYGTLKINTNFTWATVGLFYPTWADWNEPWNSGASNGLQPKVLGGNQQGFLMIRDVGTTEQPSLAITNITGTGTVTSVNHSLNSGDYIIINGAIGTVASQVNGKIFQINNVTANTFLLDPLLSSGFTYVGGGTITRLYIPFIQTKQFPMAWDLARKTRIGNQQYLFTTTAQGQVTLYIYLSQDADDPWSQPPIVPDPDSENNSLVYSTPINTCPDLYIQSCNNISLGTIGNGILTSFTFNYFSLFGIEFASLVPGSTTITVGTVATFTDNGLGGFTVTGTGNSTGSTISYNTGVVTIAFTAAPTAQTTTTNFKYYVQNIQSPTAASQAQIWHRLNTSLLGDTVQLAITLDAAQMTDPTPGYPIQFGEIELHGIIMDLNQSSLLA